MLLWEKVWPSLSGMRHRNLTGAAPSYLPLPTPGPVQSCARAHTRGDALLYSITFDGRRLFFLLGGATRMLRQSGYCGSAASVLMLQPLVLPARLLSPLIWRSAGLPVPARDAAFGWRWAKRNRRRPYRAECTGSLPTSEVKRYRGRSVLGWEAARGAPRVPSASASFAQLKLSTQRSPTCHGRTQGHAARTAGS